MKKIIEIFILLIIPLVLSGCTIEYNLEFNNKDLKEDINVYLQGTDYQVNTINNLKGIKPYAISSGLEQEPYNISFNDSGNEFVSNYKYDFTVDNFNKSHVFKTCYDAFSFTESEDYYLLSTSKIFKCLILDFEVIDAYKIKIKTNHKVLEHNADLVEKNTYIWNIDNYNQVDAIEKPILIKFSKEVSKFDSIFNSNGFIVGVAILSIALIIGIIFLIAYIKNRKNNM